jgi:hypothetical protein
MKHHVTKLSAAAGEVLDDINLRSFEQPAASKGIMTACGTQRSCVAATNDRERTLNVQSLFDHH